MSKGAGRDFDRQDSLRRHWWKEAVVYQIYPLSFADSDGDGIGDLQGIIGKLDYIAGLGVDAIWLCPHFDSPNVDNGYDIRDYRKVLREFGTMEDFDRLLEEARARNIRLIIDLVLNHTSDQHEWFVASRSGRDSSKRNYYIWRDGTGVTPNNFPSFFGGSAWQNDDATGDYYLHYFAKEQPDLNWDNPDVRADVFDIMRFWLDKGVAGFRLDVIPFISKDQTFPDLTPKQLEAPEFTYSDGPRVHDYLQEMNREVLAHYDAMTVGEAYGVTDVKAPLFVDEDRHELDMLISFDVVRLDRNGWRKTDWNLPAFKAVYSRLDRTIGASGWNAIFLSNHDNPRAVSHFGDDTPAFRVKSAKALATLVLTLRGTPFIYQGEELGMTNFPFRHVEEFDDIEVKGQWAEHVLGGKVSPECFIAHLRQTSRDHARTPMQWNGGTNAGFTSAEKPWFGVNPNYSEINAEADLAREDSIYRYFQRLIALRRSKLALTYGDYVDLDPAHERLFVYTRGFGADRLLVAVNFSREPELLGLPAMGAPWDMLLTNLSGRQDKVFSSEIQLAPWESVILEVSGD
ncbi:alpha-glucosidase [Mesorhizobium sp. M4B.F.Ca.ET.017.02.2.1]|uniref:alpha-glucosidase n=1 Tax=Mesorhizobium sp. M4B.F.Ca.ET.017.02.2.1 TaxID=2496649 RepID=UPI000FCC9AE1|nr:alpha-glucosidase [Mesorhizobium sp. M4B.F.Ca.ET.017.02.2.1]RVD30984.1 alpha-glucosidase [Mesorhizobium sp. M4B.F.Ca.ET.017.02.2.1]